MRNVLDVRRHVAAAVALVAVGVAGLALAAVATSATVTIQVGSLTIVSGTASGTISGFQPSAAVSVNGSTFTSNGSGTVTLVTAPLGGATSLTIGFVDASGTARTVTAPLNDSTTGLPLSLAELLDLIPSSSAPSTLTIETDSGTTTMTTGGTTTVVTTGGTTSTVTTGGTTTTVGGGSGGSSGGSVEGAVRLSSGLTSIPASSVHAPYRLVIKQVVFKPNLVRSRTRPITIRYRVFDSRGMVVRNAAVWMRSMPVRVVTPVKTKRTSMTGWVTFTVRPMKRLKLHKGGRVNIFVRASTPGESIIGGTSTRRLVSLRTSTPR